MVTEWTAFEDFAEALDSSNVVHDDAGDHAGFGTLQSGYAYGGPFPLQRGLVGWWPLSWTVSDAPDLAGGNDGTVSGPTQGVAGRGGLRATSFDGTDDDIHIQSGVPSLPSAYTMSMWIYPRNVSTYNIPFALRDNNDSWFRIAGGDTNNELSFAHTTSDGSANIVTSSEDILADEWTHLTATWDGSTVVLYKNAVNVGSLSASSTYDEGWEDHIGSYQDDQYYSDSVVCDVRAYNRSLPATEVQSLYTLGSADLADPPGASDYAAVSAYPFTSSNANDAWGSNDGTVNGATYVADGGPRGEGAYSFDGTDDYITTTADGVFDGLSSFSVSAWFKPENATSSTAHRRIINREDIFYFGIHDLNFSFYLGDGSAWVDALSTLGTIDNGVWQHGVWVFDNGEATVFMNGSQDDSQSTTTTDVGSNSETLTVGTQSDSLGNQVWEGNLSDIRLYSRALNPQEVFELYRRGSFGVDMTQQVVHA